MSKRFVNRYWFLLVVLSVATVMAGCTRQRAAEPTPTPTRVSPQMLETPSAQALPATKTPMPVETPVTPAPTETPAPPPPTQAPTAAVPQGLKLNAQLTKEESQTERFELEMNAPRLEGAPETITQGFNAAVEEYVSETLSGFKTMARDSAANELIPPDLVSYLLGGYQVEGVVNGVLSVRLTVEQYAAGAAHPSHANYTLNYEIAKGRLLPLAALFRSDVDYLKAISEYCVAELKKTDSFLFEDGAEPKTENYAVWNLKQDGLLITFEEYQVAPYAAGPQAVLVPYAELRDLLDPNGPLAPFAE